MWLFKKKKSAPARVIYQKPHYAGRILQAQQRWLERNRSSEDSEQTRKEKRLSYLPENLTTEDKALEVLGMKKPFTQDELKARRVVMLKQTHPDKGGSEMLVRIVNDAYEILKNKK